MYLYVFTYVHVDFVGTLNIWGMHIAVSRKKIIIIRNNNNNFVDNDGPVYNWYCLIVCHILSVYILLNIAFRTGIEVIYQA